MSSDSSPAHYGSEYPPYDPFFTADISNRMQVPDKIQLSHNQSEKIDCNNTFDPRLQMNVPERILLAGSDTHISARAPVRELRLENEMISKPEPVGLSTPPRTLTLAEHTFPSVDENTVSRLENGANKMQNGFVNTDESIQLHRTDDRKDTLMLSESPPIRPREFLNNPLGFHDELTMLHRYAGTLNRRVQSLEVDNQQLQQREWIAYSLTGLYFLLKGLLWLHRHW